MRFPNCELNPKSCAHILIALSFLITFFSFVGWWADIPLLRSIVPGRSPMTPWTATSLVLLSLAVTLLARPNSSPSSKQRTGIVFLASLPFIMSLITAISNVFDFQNPSDKWLFPLLERGADSPLHSQEMAFSTSIAILGLSSSITLLAFSRHRWKSHYQLCSIISGVMALQALVGHIFDIQALFGISQYIGMPINSSIAILLVSISTLMVRPHEGFLSLLGRRTPSNTLFWRLLSAIVAAPLIVASMIRLLEWSGIISTDFGLSIFVILTIIALVTFSYAISQKALEAESSRVKLAQEQARREQAEIAQSRINTIQCQLEFTLESTNVAFWSWDYGSKEIQWNRLKDHLFGYKEGEMARTIDSYLSHILDLDRPFVKEKLRSALKGREKEYQAEYRIVAKDKSLRWHSDRGVVSFDSNGKPLRLSGITQDITQQKRAEETLRRSEHRFRLLAHFSETLSLSLNADWLKDRLVGFLVDQLGSWAVLLEKNDQDSWVPTRSAHVLNGKEQALSHLWTKHRQELVEGFKVNSSSQTRLSTSQSNLNSEWRPYGLFETTDNPSDLQPRSFITTPLYAHKKTYGCLIVVSTCHNFSTEETELIYELAGRSSLALENAHLFQQIDNAKRSAEAANLAKNQFVANVSHEIRTPLGAILGFIDLALEAPDIPQDLVDHLSIVRRNAQQLSQLIDEVLDLSKIEADHLKVERSRFSLARILEDVSQIMSFKAKEKGIDYQVLSEGQIPQTVLSDPLRFRQILINIIGNAVKFTTDGQVSVRIKAVSPTQKEAEAILFIEVKDSGIGITPTQQERLFRPFSQADTSMSRRFGGTGLGLALSKKLAQALGGDLILKESQPNRGSTFLVSLPVGQPQQLQWIQKLASHEKVKGEPSSLFRSHLEGVKILLVEDAPDNQHLVSRFLSIAGATVKIANNGQEALEMAHREHFDAVLMDVQMPVMNGYEATKRLREEGYQTPIIALTAHALEEEKRRASQRGFSGYLTKPIDRKVLIETLGSFTHSDHALH